MPPQNQQNSNEYDASKIVRLDPREHVRLRPGMYIGGTDKRALHHLLWEMLNGAIEEFEKVAYQEIMITLLPDRNIRISDDGKGISIKEYAPIGITWLEAYMTARGQRAVPRQAINDVWPDTMLQGIGVSYITPLYADCTAEVKRDGFLWRQTYCEGFPTSQLEQIRPLETGESTGTSITFKPDFTVMDENDFDFDLIAKRCQELAYLLPQLRFIIQDKRETEQEMSYHYSQGLLEWVKKQAEYEAVMIAPLSIAYDCELIDMQGNPYHIKVQLALKWLWGDIQLIRSFVNTIETPEGGTHVVGLIAALCKHLQIRSWQTLKEGFVGIIHILHPDPQFESQSHIRLLNDDVSAAVDEAIEALFAAHPEAKAAIQAHFMKA